MELTVYESVYKIYEDNDWEWGEYGSPTLGDLTSVIDELWERLSATEAHEIEWDRIIVRQDGKVFLNAGKIE